MMALTNRHSMLAIPAEVSVVVVLTSEGAVLLGLVLRSIRQLL